MDYSITAKQLIEKLGGEKNISSVGHCMTRLRFVLKDESVVDDKAVESIPGVMGIMKKAGQYQVIIGNNVAKCFKEVNAIGNFGGGEAAPADKPKQNPINVAIDFISGCMTPLFTAIIAGGLIKVLLVVFGPTLLGLMSAESATYIILNAIGDAAFYFLPVMVAYTASKKLNCNTFLSVMVAAMLIHPDIISLLGAEGSTYFLGIIPVVHGSYASSVIPAMLSTILLKYVEIGVDKITPEWSKNFLKPLLIVLIVAPVTLCVLAPAGVVVGDGLQFVLNAIYNFAPFLAMAVFAGLMPFIVMTGMHWAFVPAALLALSNPGYELMLLPAMLCSNTAQAGATFAVAFKTKDKNMKQMAFPAAVSALLAGVTEPAMYGVTLKLKKPMYAACVASAISGAITGFVHLGAYAFATPCLTAIVQFIAPDGGNNFLFAVIIFAISFVASFVLTFIVTKDEKETLEESDQKDAAIENKEKEVAVLNPVEGEIVPLSEVNDPTFASEILGKGFAVKPMDGKVVAPFDGTVDVLMDSHHAVGITSDTGITLLIHVGLETVTLNGKYFIPHVAVGEKVKQGDLLLSFDMENIKKEGFDLVTPVIVTNTDDFSEMETIKSGNAKAGEKVLVISK